MAASTAEPRAEKKAVPWVALWVACSVGPSAALWVDQLAVLRAVPWVAMRAGPKADPWADRWAVLWAVQRAGQ